MYKHSIYYLNKNIILSMSRWMLFCVLSFGAAQAVYAQDLVPYRKANQWGFADEKRKIVIPCDFEEVQPFLIDLAKVKKDGKWGLISKDGKTFLPCQYDIIYAASKLGRVVVAQGGDQSGHGGKWGFVRKYAGQEIELTYDLIRECGIDNLLGVKKEGRWGAISGQDNVVIPTLYEVERVSEHSFEEASSSPTFLRADNLHTSNPTKSYLKLEFEEGLARVRKDGKWGFLNRYGNAVIPCVYDFLGELRQGLVCAIVSDSLGIKKMGVLNGKNEWIIPPEYDFSEAFYKEQLFRDALIPVCRAGKWGFINTKNEIAIPLQYPQVKPFAEGKALVNLSSSSIKAQWQLIDKAGKSIFEFKEGVSPVDKRYWEGAFRVLENGQMYFLNLKGEKIGTESFEKTKIFKNGLVQVACLREGTLKWGVLQISGAWAIPPEYDFEEDFYLRFLRDTFVAKKNGKWGIVSPKNEVILPFEYEGIQLPFYERPEIFFRYGLVAVKKDGKWGYVNFKNKVEIPFKYLAAQAFEGAYARVKTSAGWGYIDQKGKEFFED